MKYTAGEEITNSKLNDRRGYNWTGVYARMTTSQSIPTDTLTKVQINIKVYDDGNNFDTTTFRYTAPEPGLYLISARLTYQAPVADKSYTVEIEKNGNQIAVATKHASLVYDLDTEVFGIFSLVQNDYIEIFTSHGSGATRNLEFADLFIIRIA